MKKEIGSNVYSKLVSKGYLHSNYYNFIRVADVNSRMATHKQSQETKEVIDKLRNLSNYSKKIERLFYDDLSVRDSYEFELKYLITDNLKNETIQQVAIRVINSEDFLNHISDIIDYNRLADSIFKDFGTSGKSISNRAQLGDEIINELVMNDFENEFNKMFREFLGRGAGSKVKIQKSSNKNVQKFINVKMEEFGNEIYIDENIKNLVNYFEEKVKKELNDKQQKIISGDEEEILKKMKEKLKVQIKAAAKDGNLTSKSSQIGVLLEISLDVAGLGKNIGNIKDEKGRKTGSDLIITGKSGREYKIQLKNSFSTSPFMNIKLQDSIKLETFLQKLDSSQQNEIGYLLANILYLKEYGLNQNGKPRPLKINTVAKTRDYIKVLLNEVIYTFLGQEYIDTADEEIKNNTSNIGNLFFIYQGRYLIPISAFLDNAIKIIEEGSVGKDTLGNVQIPTLMETKAEGGFSLESAVQLQKQKRKVIKNYKGRNYSYPNSLIEIGSEPYYRLIKNTSIRGLRYVSNINNIEAFIKGSV